MSYFVPSGLRVFSIHPKRGLLAHAVESSINFWSSHSGYAERSGRLADSIRRSSSRKYGARPSLWSTRWKSSVSGRCLRSANSSLDSLSSLYICSSTTLRRARVRSGWRTGLKYDGFFTMPIKVAASRVSRSAASLLKYTLAADFIPTAL